MPDSLDLNRAYIATYGGEPGRFPSVMHYQLCYRRQCLIDTTDEQLLSRLEAFRDMLNRDDAEARYEEAPFDPSNLDHGLYKIYWRSGGYSVASVGSCDDGTRWMAPTNWVGGHGEPWTNWAGVLRVELVMRMIRGETG